MFVFVLYFELVGGSMYGNYSYVWFVAAEEGLEMIGVTIFLVAAMLKNKNLFETKV